MTITGSVVADYVAGRLDLCEARAVEAAACQHDEIALRIWTARDHARRARHRILRARRQSDF